MHMRQDVISEGGVIGVGRQQLDALRAFKEASMLHVHNWQ